MERYPALYPPGQPIGSGSGSASGASAAASMDLNDMMDMERVPLLAPLSRSQLQRLLRNSLLFGQPNTAAEALSLLTSAAAAAAAAASNNGGGYGGIGGAGTYGNGLQENGLSFTSHNGIGGNNNVGLSKALPFPLYGARLLRMQMQQIPEMKRTARGRSMQCYFNPISCY